jgi:hypothetical protein
VFFRPNENRDMAEQSEWGDERDHELVRLFHHDLMVPLVLIKQAEGFTPQG